MADEQNALSKHEVLISQKERELLLQRNEVWKFVDTEHKSKETEEYQAKVRKAARELGEILQSLVELQETSAQFKKGATALCKRCNTLEIYSRDMQNCLAEDFAKRQKAEEGAKVNVIQNVTFFVAVPAAFMTAAKNGFLHGQIDIDQAAEAGLAVSVSVLLRKSIANAFKGVGKSLCQAPQQVRNSVLLYYAKELAKEKAIEVTSCFRTGAVLLMRNLPARVTNQSTLLKRLTATGKPGV